MHYYKRNIGDYSIKAGKLTMLQHGAYTLIMDCCYDREQFPTREQAIEWTWAVSDEEIAAVEFVLSRFFTLEGEHYVQKRIAEELGAYHDRAAINKKNRAKGIRTGDESSTNGDKRSPNHKPLTNNHKQITKFIRPKPNEVEDYAQKIGFSLDGNHFCDYYEARGWRLSTGPMKDWKAAVRTWKRNRKEDKEFKPREIII
jgi:uncharacterized protein YdaU (DUF1376 family)